MKEAFFGVLIVLLGLIGIVIMQVFQDITVTNDQTYYLLKEVTEASMLDSIDLTYYRTKGKIRIVKDKFAENIARRFAESVNLNRDYNIVIHDIIEDPPKVSLSIGTRSFSLQGDKFNIGQSLDSIIEAKYTAEEGGTVITPGEVEDPDDEEDVYPDNPDDSDEDLCPICEAGDPNCGAITECITGDLKFVSWGNVAIPSKVCPTDSIVDKTRVANYQICECGKWKEQSQDVASTLTKTATEYTYSWHFLKSTNVRTIDLTSTKKGSFDKCTTNINIDCPNGVIKIMKNQQYTITPTYIPSDAVNRGLTWISSDTSIATVQYPAPNLVGPTGISKAIVTGKKIGSSVITVKTTNNKSDTCNVEVIDGWACPTATIEMFVNSTAQAYIKDRKIVSGMTWKVDNTSIATINSNTGVIKSKGSVATINYIVNVSGLPTLKCPLKIKKEENPDTTPTGCTPGQISVSWNTTHKTLPKLCPQDFDLGSISSYAINAIGNITSKASYCGYKGGYTYPEKATWDKTEQFLLNLTDATVSISSNKYKITLSKKFTYEGWNTDVGPYTTNISEVTKTYLMTGDLLNKESDTCRNKVAWDYPVVFLNDCPSYLIEGTSEVRIESFRAPTDKFTHDSFIWTTSNASILKITDKNSGNYVKVKPIGSGTVKLKYEGTADDGTRVRDECLINIYPKCGSVYISGPSTFLRTETKTYSISPSFGGESDWSSSNNNILKITDTSTYRKSNEIKGKGVGSATITIIRRVDNCKKTLPVKIEQKWVCPKIDGYQTSEYEYNSSYCYTRYKKAPFICSSSYPYSASGYCFKDYSSWYGWYYYGANVSKVSPNACNPWKTGYVGSLGYCYYLYNKIIAPN